MNKEKGIEYKKMANTEELMTIIVEQAKNQVVLVQTIEEIRDSAKNIEAHFTNGFRSEIRDDVNSFERRIGSKLTKIIIGLFGFIAAIMGLIGIIVKLLP